MCSTYRYKGKQDLHWTFLKGIVHPDELHLVCKHALWYFSREHVSKTDREEKKLLNKVIILVFFAHKKYSRSFITLQLNHWCHMDYFNDVLTTFLGLEPMQGQKALGFQQKYLNLCFEDERRSYRFGTTWGWVINDTILILGWTIPLTFKAVSSTMGTLGRCNFKKNLSYNRVSIV